MKTKLKSKLKFPNAKSIFIPIPKIILILISIILIVWITTFYWQFISLPLPSSSSTPISTSNDITKSLGSVSPSHDSHYNNNSPSTPAIPRSPPPPPPAALDHKIPYGAPFMPSSRDVLLPMEKEKEEGEREGKGKDEKEKPKEFLLPHKENEIKTLYPSPIPHNKDSFDGSAIDRSHRPRRRRKNPNSNGEDDEDNGDEMNDINNNENIADFLFDNDFNIMDIAKEKEHKNSKNKNGDGINKKKTHRLSRDKVRELYRKSLATLPPSTCHFESNTPLFDLMDHIRSIDNVLSASSHYREISSLLSHKLKGIFPSVEDRNLGFMKIENMEIFSNSTKILSKDEGKMVGWNGENYDNNDNNKRIPFDISPHISLHWDEVSVSPQCHSISPLSLPSLPFQSLCFSSYPKYNSLHVSNRRGKTGWPAICGRAISQMNNLSSTPSLNINMTHLMGISWELHRMEEYTNFMGSQQNQRQIEILINERKQGNSLHPSLPPTEFPPFDIPGAAYYTFSHVMVGPTNGFVYNSSFLFLLNPFWPHRSELDIRPFLKHKLLPWAYGKSPLGKPNAHQWKKETEEGGGTESLNWEGIRNTTICYDEVAVVRTIYDFSFGPHYVMEIMPIVALFLDLLPTTVPILFMIPSDITLDSFKTMGFSTEDMRRFIPFQYYHVYHVKTLHVMRRPEEISFNVMKSLLRRMYSVDKYDKYYGEWETEEERRKYLFSSQTGNENGNHNSLTSLSPPIPYRNDEWRSRPHQTLRIIFMKRHFQHDRRVSNHEEILIKLREHFTFPQYEIIEFVGENNTLSESKEMFGSAEVVIGPHGGSFLNMIFLRPFSSVVEFAYPSMDIMSFPTFYFLYGCSSLKLNHFLLFGDEGSYVSNMVMNVREVIEITQKAIDNVGKRAVDTWNVKETMESAEKFMNLPYKKRISHPHIDSPESVAPKRKGEWGGHKIYNSPRYELQRHVGVALGDGKKLPKKTNQPKNVIRDISVES